MRLTRFGLHGLLFYLVMLGAFFAAPYSNLFFLLLGFLTVLGAAGLVSAHRNLRRVTAALAEIEPVPSHQSLRVPVQVHAPSPARFQITAHLLLGNGQRLSGRIDLVEGDATLILSAPALARGCHAVTRAFLESTHPFELVRMRRALAAPAELVVFPAPRALLEGRSAAEALDELLGRAGQGTDDLQPTSLRDHRAGDGVRRIHWRASARRARLVVQEWEGGTGQGLEVVLDRRCSPDELEQALATLSALVQLARTNKESLKIYSQDLSATFGNGHRPWAAALRFLALAAPLPENAPGPPPVAPAVARLPRTAAVQPGWRP